MKIALPVLAAIALVACQPAADTPENDDAAPIPSGSDAGVEARAAPAILALDPEGLRFVDEATGSTRLLPFGAPQAEALSAVTGALGQATGAGDLEECGAGPLHFTDFDEGLQLLFSDGSFAGWSSSGGLTTMDGLSADAIRYEVEAAGVTSFTRDTLEDEFELGGIHGVMEPGGQEVELLHVGVNCFMR